MSRNRKKKSGIATFLPLILIVLAIGVVGGYLFFFKETPEFDPEADTSESISVQVKPGQGQEDTVKDNTKRKREKEENEKNKKEEIEEEKEAEKNKINLSVSRDEYGGIYESYETPDGGVYFSYHADGNDYVNVYFIDVGQGDSILIKYVDNSPSDGDDSAAMLIDAGDENSGTLVRNFLKAEDVSELKYFVCTHPDADHIGGAASVVSNIPITSEMVFAPKYEKDTKTYKKLLNEIKYKSYKYCPPKTGTMYLLGKAELRFYVPEEQFDDPNNNSIICKLTYGEGSVLFTGDCSAAEEDELLDERPFDLKADILKVGHHGSDASSTKPFLDAVDPKYAVISCGEDNSYGHPHKSVVERLEDMDMEIYRTDEIGSIRLRLDGSDFYKWTYSGK